MSHMNIEALVFHPFWCLGAQRKGMVIAMNSREKGNAESGSWPENFGGTDMMPDEGSSIAV